MKRFFKQSVAAALCAAMVITLMPGNDADAAKKVKISKKATVAVGQTKTIKVKNASKKAKVTWKVKKASIAKITGKVTKGKKAKVTIQGVSAGKTKLTGTYKLGKKKTKLTCTVTVTPGAANPTTTQPAGQVTVQPTQSVGQPTSPAVGTDKPNPTKEPTAKPTRTPRVTSAPTPVPTPKYQKPDVTAEPVVKIPLAEGSFYNEGTEENAAVTYNEDGTMTIVFKTQWAAVNFVLPDNAQNYYSEYKSAVLTYKSEGTFAQNEEGNANGLGHALFDADWDPSGTDMAAGKHPDYGRKISQSDDYTTKVFNVTSECVGGCIRGLQIFNPNEMGEGDSVTITIKSMIFYNEEKADDFVPSEQTTPPSENPSAEPSDEPSAEPIIPATVTLSKENEAVANTTITYEDGKAKCAFEADSAGHGVRWNLNGADGIDLSKYKVVINYEGANTEKPYGMCLQLESNDGVAGDWWNHNATIVSTQKPLYTDTGASGAGKWELTGDAGMAYQLFIKYNTWVSDGEVARTDAAEFTITSIDIVEK